MFYVYKVTFLATYTVLNIKFIIQQGQDVDRLLISHPYQSLIGSQNCCLDNLNPSFVIGSTVNQFETQLLLIYPQAIFLCYSFLLLIIR